MTYHFRCALALALTFLVLLAAAPALAQLNPAYTDGYKAIVGYRSNLETLTKDDTQHEQAKLLGQSYVARLEVFISHMESIGKGLKDGDNQSWAGSVRSASIAAARTARTRADAMRAAGEARTNYKGHAIDLEKAVKELDTEFRKCHEAHEKRLRELYDNYVSTRERFQNETKNDRRPIEDQARKVDDLRKAMDTAQQANDGARRIYAQLHEYSDKLRDELAKMDKDKTPSEYERKWGDWKTSEELVRRGGKAVVETSGKFVSASRAYCDALNEYESKSEAYNKEMAEGNLLYELTIQRHRRMFELSQEYKPFSW